MLDEERSRGLSLVDVGVDYTKVEPIQHKRVLAFINHFAIHTSHFLNRFSSTCEEKLSSVEERIRRLDVTINILETKLSSISGLESVTGEAYQPPASVASACRSGKSSTLSSGGDNANAPTAPAAPQQQPQQSQAPTPSSQPAAPPAPNRDRDSDSDSDFDDDASTATGATTSGGGEASGTPVSKDPRYVKYFNLLKIGVPVAAFRGKMLAEGLDPDLMETPDAAAPPSSGGGGLGLPSAADSDEDEDDDDDDADDGDDDDDDDMSD